MLWASAVSGGLCWPVRVPHCGRVGWAGDRAPAPPEPTAKGLERDLHQPVLPQMGSSQIKGSACPHDLSVLSIYRTRDAVLLLSMSRSPSLSTAALSASLAVEDLLCSLPR